MQPLPDSPASCSPRPGSCRRAPASPSTGAPRRPSAFPSSGTPCHRPRVLRCQAATCRACTRAAGASRRPPSRRRRSPAAAAAASLRRAAGPSRRPRAASRRSVRSMPATIDPDELGSSASSFRRSRRFESTVDHASRSASSK
jgi:hypothetical protein